MDMGLRRRQRIERTFGLSECTQAQDRRSSQKVRRLAPAISPRRRSGEPSRTRSIHDDTLHARRRLSHLAVKQEQGAQNIPAQTRTQARLGSPGLLFSPSGRAPRRCIGAQGRLEPFERGHAWPVLALLDPVERFGTNSGTACQLSLRQPACPARTPDRSGDGDLQCFGGRIIPFFVARRQRWLLPFGRSLQPPILALRHDHEALAAERHRLRRALHKRDFNLHSSAAGIMVTRAIYELSAPLTNLSRLLTCRRAGSLASRERRRPEAGGRSRKGLRSLTLLARRIVLISPPLPRWSL